MKERGELPSRRSIRLKGYDYTRDGAYFVTICTHGRERTFGAVIKGEMRLNACGREVARCWAWLAEQYPYVYLDEWIVMPDHTHAIIVIKDNHGNDAVYHGSNVADSNGVVAGSEVTDSNAVDADVAGADVTNSNETGGGGSRTALPRSAPNAGFMGPPIITRQRKPLGRLIGAFKTVSTKRVNDISSTPDAQLWQRNYYERVIRNSISLRALRRYIANNTYL